MTDRDPERVTDHHPNRRADTAFVLELHRQPGTGRYTTREVPAAGVGGHGRGALVIGWTQVGGVDGDLPPRHPDRDAGQGALALRAHDVAEDRAGVLREDLPRTHGSAEPSHRGHGEIDNRDAALRDV